MDAQFLFHWLTKLFTYYEDFLNHIKNETLDEIKTSQENLWQQMIQLWVFPVLIHAHSETEVSGSS